MTFNGSVRRTPELSRILSLPRRRLDDVATPALAADFTDALRRDDGCPGQPNAAGMCTLCNVPMRLRPLQAAALAEIGTLGGAFCPIEVGGGKTLISLLAAYVLDAERPLLLLPAGLIEKTARDRARLSRHWLIPTNIRLLSYEMLGRVQSESFLFDAKDKSKGFKPDLILCDEVQKLKNRHAAVTRRVARYMHAHPTARFVALSGTIMDRSLLEFGHILRWSLKDGAPLPRTVEELEEWALAIDERVDDFTRLGVGALTALGGDDLAGVRRGFQRRLVETPGVVATFGGGEHIGASLYIRPVEYDVRPVTDEWFAKLRDTMNTPDDWELEQGVDVWRHARELALGFHSIWSPRPPDEWLMARRAWFGFVRATLSYSRTLDSPLAVELAVDAGTLPDGAATLGEWRRVKDSFVPNPVPVWHDDSALEVCAKWMRSPGIVWTSHVPFARRLAERTGAAYYGQDGCTDAGAFIDDADGKRAIIASSAANREGRNLQNAWSRNLITAPAEGPGWWQQLIGRTHRTGQPADEVIVDVLVGCREHANAFARALASAEAVRDTTGSGQKLLIADIEPWPDIDGRPARRWG